MADIKLVKRVLPCLACRIASVPPPGGIAGAFLAGMAMSMHERDTTTNVIESFCPRHTANWKSHVAGLGGGNPENLVKL